VKNKVREDIQRVLALKKAMEDVFFLFKNFQSYHDFYKVICNDLEILKQAQVIEDHD
jgi:ubiquinone biosynthesis protein Coq4